MGGCQVPITAFFEGHNCLLVVDCRFKRFNLLLQLRNEGIGSCVSGAGNIVDRLVRVELCALTTRSVQGFDNTTLDTQQAEFKCLEQTNRPGADNQRFCVDIKRSVSQSGVTGKRVVAVALTSVD